MTDRWSVLTTRLGKDVREPADADLEAALADVFSTVDMEHPNAWLRVGLHDGTMFVLDVYRAGTIIFSQWADSDFEDELAPSSKLVDASVEHALGLWRSLLRGDFGAVRAKPWRPI